MSNWLAFVCVLYTVEQSGLWLKIRRKLQIYPDSGLEKNMDMIACKAVHSQYRCLGHISK